MLIVLFFAWIFRLIGWRGALLVVFGAVLVVGPWLGRNALVFHRPVSIASNGGYNFLIGNNVNTVPYSGAGTDVSKIPVEGKDLNLDEFQMDHNYEMAAWDWITHHPGHAAVLYLGKTLNFFNVWNEYASWNSAEISPWKQIIMGFSYALLLGLLAWRLVEAKSFPLSSREKFFLMVYVGSAFASALFFTRIRLRLPFDYLIIAVIAAHLSRRLGLERADKPSDPPAVAQGE